MNQTKSLFFFRAKRTCLVVVPCPSFQKDCCSSERTQQSCLTSRVDSLCDLNDAHGWTSPSKTGDSIQLIQKFKPEVFCVEREKVGKTGEPTLRRTRSLLCRKGKGGKDRRANLAEDGHGQTRKSDKVYYVMTRVTYADRIKSTYAMDKV